MYESEKNSKQNGLILHRSDALWSLPATTGNLVSNRPLISGSKSGSAAVDTKTVVNISTKSFGDTEIAATPFNSSAIGFLLNIRVSLE
jgi:hypothetical protein